jgi:hypothetical protein
MSSLRGELAHGHDGWNSSLGMLQKIRESIFVYAPFVERKEVDPEHRE